MHAAYIIHMLTGIFASHEYIQQRANESESPRPRALEPLPFFSIAHSLQSALNIAPLPPRSTIADLRFFATPWYVYISVHLHIVPHSWAADKVPECHVFSCSVIHCRLSHSVASGRS